MASNAYFFDSSAMVKRYHREAGSAWVQAICAARLRPPIYLSQLAQVEVVAALRRAGRIEGMHPSSAQALVNLFLRDARHYRLWQVTPAVIQLAIALCNKHWLANPQPLRALDAVQLSSTLLISAHIPDELIFVTSDTRLAAVAAAEGFRVVNLEYPPSP